MTCIVVAPYDSSIPLPLLTDLAIKNHLATCKDDMLSLMYWNGSARDTLYEFTDRIENKLESDHIAGNLCCGLVAGIDEKNEIDPVESSKFGKIIAGLILIFPEIQWYFLGVEDLPSIFDDPHKRQVSLFSPLFDAYGVREKLIDKATESTNSVEPKPKPLGVVVEDELNFCFYHSYVIYRSGYRVLPVTSYAAFKNIKKWFPCCASPTVLIENMSLGFFDRERGEETSLILLKKRDKHECGYGEISKKAKLRALVTTGQPELTSDKSNKEANQEDDSQDLGKDESNKDHSQALPKNEHYLQCCEKRERIQTNTKIECKKGYFAVEAKPVGGIFRLVELLALKKFVSGEDEEEDEEEKKRRLSGNHSAPGMVQAIVEVMFSRVRRRRDREGLLDILLGGVLSRDVLKLLHKKAPMLRFDALFSQHENEVRAESKFINIGPVRDVKDRFKEIDEDVKKIAKACQEENQRRVELQAQATIAYRMMLVFRNAAQYDEELVCLNYLRKAQRHLSRLPARKTQHRLRDLSLWTSIWGGVKRCVKSISLRKMWDFLKWCAKSIAVLPRTYAELLVSGGYWRPILALVSWPLLLTAVVYSTSADLTTAWQEVTSGFFQADAVPDETKMKEVNWKFLKPFVFGLGVVLIGLFHVGVFISFVFGKLMRR